MGKSAAQHQLQKRPDLKWIKRKQQFKAVTLMNQCKKAKQTNKQQWRKLKSQHKKARYEEQKQSWMTPSWLMIEIRKCWNIALDAACSIKARRRKAWRGLQFITPEQDALQTQWKTEGWVFCNPPYKNLLPWINHALQQLDHCQGIVMLLPNYSNLYGPSWNPKWWQIVLTTASHIYYGGIHLAFEKWIHGRAIAANVSPFVSILAVW